MLKYCRRLRGDLIPFIAFEHFVPLSTFGIFVELTLSVRNFLFTLFDKDPRRKVCDGPFHAIRKIGSILSQSYLGTLIIKLRTQLRDRINKM